MSTVFARALAAGLLTGALGAAAFAGQASAQTIQPPPRPAGIASGPDGNLWFTEVEGNRIGRITPAGAVREFPTGPDSSPVGITTGSDGNLWFTLAGRDAIGRITPAGAGYKVHRWPDRNQGETSLGLSGITSGPDGNLWFTERNANRIGRITPQGAVTEFSAGLSPDSAPAAITAGADGNLWFTEAYGNRIGRITPQGAVAEFSTGLGPTPQAITAGPDGNVWFTTSSYFSIPRVGKITPAGTITTFNVGTERFGDLAGIAAGPDGNLWFTEFSGRIVGRITNSGELTEFPIPGEPREFSSEIPAGITAGPDGAMWFAASSESRIGRISVTGSRRLFPPLAQILGARAGGNRAVIARVRCPLSACRGTVRVTGELEPQPPRFEQPAQTPIGARRFALGARSSASVVVPLSARGRRLLRARGQLSTVVSIQPLPNALLGTTGDGWYVQLWVYRSIPATVVGVVDGDTIQVRIHGRVTPVRLMGADAPETAPRSSVDMCFGPAATARTRRLLPSGQHVTLVLARTEAFVRDTLGRLPAYVYKPGRHGPTGSVNYALVATGYAMASPSPHHPHQDALEAAQSKAQRMRRGLWGPPCNGDVTKPDRGNR